MSNRIPTEGDLLALRITADKMEIKDSPKLPSATSFIRKPLCFMLEDVQTMELIG